MTAKIREMERNGKMKKNNRHTDTERLDWLEENEPDISSINGTFFLTWIGGKSNFGTTLRKAIDAAMKRGW